MINKKTIFLGLSALIYSNISIAALYINQEEHSNNKSAPPFVVKNEYSTSKEIKRNNKTLEEEIDKEVKQLATGKEPEKNKEKSEDKKLIVKKDNHEKKEIVSNKNLNQTVSNKNNSVKNPPDVLGKYNIKPVVKKNIAQMEKGYLSNSMRKELEKLGWQLRWTSGSDREIRIPYTVEYESTVDFVKKVSNLYSIMIDVYPSNKTIHVQD